MAPPWLLALWALIKERSFANVRTVNLADFAVKGMVQCRNRKCRSWKTLTTEVQTRSADEPMTVKVFCTECERRWKL